MWYNVHFSGDNVPPSCGRQKLRFREDKTWERALGVLNLPQKRTVHQGSQHGRWVIPRACTTRRACLEESGLAQTPNKGKFFREFAGDKETSEQGDSSVENVYVLCCTGQISQKFPRAS